jgi:hypothetical protein
MKATVISTALIAVGLLAGSAVAQTPGASSQPKQQLSGTGDFCLKGSTGPIRCEYQTMAQCDQARPQGSADQCVARSQAAGTTGGPTLREQPNSPGGQKD